MTRSVRCQPATRELSLNTQDRDKQTGQASRLADSAQPKTDHSQSFTWTNKRPVGRYVGFFVSKHFSVVFISQTDMANKHIDFIFLFNTNIPMLYPLKFFSLANNQAPPPPYAANLVWGLCMAYTSFAFLPPPLPKYAPGYFNILLAV